MLVQAEKSIAPVLACVWSQFSQRNKLCTSSVHLLPEQVLLEDIAGFHSEKDSYLNLNLNITGQLFFYCCKFDIPYLTVVPFKSLWGGESTESFSGVGIGESLLIFINTNPEHDQCEIWSLQVMHRAGSIQLLFRQCFKRHIQCSKTIWKTVPRSFWENIVSMFQAWVKPCLFSPN